MAGIWATAGFRRLLENGVHFVDAHHRHANTETIVGHTTLATGTDPAIHGMVANLWFDRIGGTQFYNVQDPDFPLVGAAGVDAASEIDPTQRAATTDGRSPRNILTSTISDEIALHFGPEAKIFGVSVKDRGAISMAGHAGTAYWFSKAEGRFVTSTFYRDAYPDWVADWAAKGMVASYAGAGVGAARRRPRPTCSAPATTSPGRPISRASAAPSRMNGAPRTTSISPPA